MSGNSCLELSTELLKEGLLKSGIESLPAYASKQANPLHYLTYLYSFLGIMRKDLLNLQSFNVGKVETHAFVNILDDYSFLIFQYFDQKRMPYRQDEF